MSADAYPARRPAPAVEHVTAAELLALRYISHGCTYEQTADACGVPLSTMQDRLHRLRLKLGAKNTAHAMAIAMRHGLIP